MNNKVRLFCFPYAGGSASTYLIWKKYLNNSIELCPVELAGRGTRLTESFYNGLEERVREYVQHRS